MTPWTFAEIERAIRASWAADTCSPDDMTRAGWQPDNPAWGHCDVTALVVHDIFGGDLVMGEVFVGAEQQGYHWWNRLASGVDLDLTREQFRRGQTVVGARVRRRPPGRLPRRHEEYERFRHRVEGHLGPLPGGAV
jgi:hypothetical protein